MNAMKKAVQVAVRIEQTSLDLADEIVELIGSTSPVPTNRTMVLRIAIERGLAAMRAELPGSAKRRK